jgi:hypothetical protein
MMKRRLGTWALPLLLSWPAQGGCAPGEDEDVPTPPLTAEEESHAGDVGSRATAMLQGTLAPRLMGAMEAGGPVAAVRFCSEVADSLTRVAADSAGLDVKRTSRRIRNPDNAPDPFERAALDHFHAIADRGDSLPAGWVQVVSAEEMRFYAPLVVQPLCVSCHGPADALAPELRRLLAETYPDDRAVGYQPGDLRGLVRVTIPRTAR